jgi:hypothetical protein
MKVVPSLDLKHLLINATILVIASLSVVQTMLYSIAQQSTTTFTAPTQTFGCSGSFCTLDGVTVTQYTPPNPNPSPIPVWVWVLGAVAGIVTIIVVIALKKKSRQERTESQNNKPTPSMIVPTPMPNLVAGQSLDERILSYVEGHHGEISISRASYEIGVTESELKESLSRLSEKGVIRSEGNP